MYIYDFAFLERFPVVLDALISLAQIITLVDLGRPHISATWRQQVILTCLCICICFKYHIFQMTHPKQLLFYMGM